MYKKYIEQLEEAGKIRNLKDRSIHCYKNYVSYFLNYTSKRQGFPACQKRQRTQIDNSESLQFCTPLFLPECPAHPMG